MYVRVRSMDGSQNVTLTISRLTTVGNFKKLIENELNVPVKKLKLFYRGKQLEHGYKLFDYNVNVNDVIQFMIFEEPVAAFKSNQESKIEENSSESISEQDSTKNVAESMFYRVNDLIEAKDKNFCGSWFEGKIIGIYKDLDKYDCDPSNPLDDGLLYKVFLLRFPNDPPSLVELKELRPRSKTMIPLSEVSIGDKIMINYNLEDPGQRGYWYDLLVTSLKPLTGTLYAGMENTEMADAKVKFRNEIFKIEETKRIDERTPDELELIQKESEKPRQYPPYCSICKDSEVKPCKECSCNICGGKDSPGKQVFCEECNMVFHLWCLDPPLQELPTSEQWYCYKCKNDENEIVTAGGCLKSLRKSSSSSKDWGKGMACVRRTKECTIVSKNHFGPIPGIEVGTTWKFRVQVSEAGVHRPHVAGIAGRENEGAVSLVISGGYEDDEDNGDEFTYTGSGGRDLSGNKRTAEQSSDQTLTRMNKALALNCNTAINDEKGATAKDWKGGKPVRVVRNYKAARDSKFAPKEGNRYDGIYKVVKYYPETGKSGFIVWKFLLRRDDNNPAPWTPKGKEKMASLGLEVIYPDGYLEAMEAKEKKVPEETHLKKKEKKRKRVLEVNNENKLISPPPVKKMKFTAAYELEKKVQKLIQKDEVNMKLWNSTLDCLSLGKQKFLNKVEEVFMCICCQEVLFNPVTTPCSHNFCKSCLMRCFDAEVYMCPHCRAELEKNLVMDINQPLQDALSALFPGYTADR